MPLAPQSCDDYNKAVEWQISPYSDEKILLIHMASCVNSPTKCCSPRDTYNTQKKEDYDSLTGLPSFNVQESDYVEH